MDAVKAKLGSEEFLRWAQQQPGSPRYELVDGEPVAMAPERIEHARVKHRTTRVLQDAIAERGLDCEALPDGVGVIIDDSTLYEPDALIVCNEELDGSALAVRDATAIVEVLSPSTRGRDTGAKLDDYFRLPSLRHYLLIKTETRTVIHHAKDGAGKIVTSILKEGALDLDPPGIRVALSSLFS